MSARDELADTVASALHEDVYVCTRVWAAWGVETMSADDFMPAAEDPDLLIEVADAILAWIEERYIPKPRPITTVDELNTLPQSTKLYSSKTTHSWHLNDLSRPHGGTRVQGTGGGYIYLEDFIKHEAPLTILYTPGAA